MLACVTAVAGCAHAPEPLLASTAIVAQFPLQAGPKVEAARFSAESVGAPPWYWEPFVV